MLFSWRRISILKKRKKSCLRAPRNGQPIADRRRECSTLRPLVGFLQQLGDSLYEHRVHHPYVSRAPRPHISAASRRS